MLRPQIAVALSAACFALIVFLGLLPPTTNLLYFKFDWTTCGRAWRYIVPSSLSPKIANDEYLLGVGKADITGPVAEINLMGYADPSQLGTGLRQRLYARAFIVGSRSSENERFAYLVLDTQSGDTAIRDGILRGLAALGPSYSMYNQQNVAITGTHSHSGPGAWLNYLLPQITSRGFHQPSYDAIVTGTILAVRRAHLSLVPGRLGIGSTDIEDANINRSLWAYLANPEEERDKYEHSVDKTLTMLNFQRTSDGKSIGVLTWFPVHGTSMLGNNTLVTGDNKGVAAYLMERNARESASGTFAEGFVAGFSQANVGDTSPNVLGAYCEDEVGGECEFQTSVCANNRSQACHGRGPFYGLDDAGTKSCFEIGRRQYEGAQRLFESMMSSTATIETTSLSGSVHAVHVFRDLGNFTFPHPNGTVVRTCPAALGYSFAAGTTDGPGAFDFKQNNSGEANANPLWARVRNFLHEPNEDQIACHAPKPILLDVGETLKPYMWTPNIVDIQLFRVGQLVIVVAPGEATTMAGRRWREAIATSAGDMSDNRAQTPLVVLGGPANTYAHYIATEEEYSRQRYEGASTLYGPHTLNAYIYLSRKLLPYLYPPTSTSSRANLLSLNPYSRPRTSTSLPPLDRGPQPPIHTNTSLSFITPVLFDSPGLFRHFGQLLQDVSSTYQRSSAPTISARFVGATPRNNLRLEGTFAAVERLRAGSNTESMAKQDWVMVRDDKDWELVYRWRRTNTALGTSEVEISWEVPRDMNVGRYRLVYYGDWKRIGSGKVEGFIGYSGVFELV